MVNRILLCLIVILLASGSITSQCYNLGFPGDISFDPANPIPGVGGMTTLTFTYTNFGEEIPLNANGGESISICYQQTYLKQVDGIYGTGADFFEENEFLGCAFLSQTASIPTGVYEFNVDFISLDDSSQEDNDGQGFHCVNVNLQPSGIHSGSACFDPKDDAVLLCTWTDSTSTSLVDPVQSELNIFPNPATDIINLEYVNGNNYSVAVIDAKGRRVLNSGLVKSIDVRLLDAGVYFLRLHDLDTDKMIYKEIVITK